MKKTAALLVILPALLTLSCHKGSITDPNDVVVGHVETLEASGVGSFTATINGRLVLENRNIPSGCKVLFRVGGSSDPKTLLSTGTEYKASVGTGRFSCSLKGLTPSATYYYIALADPFGKEYVGKVQSFTTGSLGATVKTHYPADAVNMYSATISGSVAVAADDTEIPYVWFCYGTTESTLITAGTKTSSRSIKGAFTEQLSSLTPNTTYYFLACAKVHGQTLYGEVKQFTTNNFPAGVIDLGLSVLWATGNLLDSGIASGKSDTGYFYAWGETSAKSAYSWTNYKWCKGTYNTLTRYNTNTNYGSNPDHKYCFANYDYEDDAARKRLGGLWAVPSDAQWEELKSNCDWKWEQVDGVYGRRYTSKKNGKNIFLPAVGYWDGTTRKENGSEGVYWTSDLYTSVPQCGRTFRFKEAGMGVVNTVRCYGASIRPVYVKK